MGASLSFYFPPSLCALLPLSYCTHPLVGEMSLRLHPRHRVNKRFRYLGQDDGNEKHVTGMLLRHLETVSKFEVHHGMIDLSIWPMTGQSSSLKSGKCDMQMHEVIILPGWRFQASPLLRRARGWRSELWPLDSVFAHAGHFLPLCPYNCGRK